MKYFLLQLGCQMNKADGERVHAVLSLMGYEATDDEHEASLCGVIACSVRQKAIDKVYSRIAKWNAMANRASILTFATGCILPQDKLALAKRFDLLFDIAELANLPRLIAQYGAPSGASVGIMQALQDEAVVEASPVQTRLYAHEGAPSPTSEAHSVALTQINALRSQASTRVLSPYTPISHAKRDIGALWNITPQYSSAYEAYVPIQNGCNKMCTFCAVPYTRGREISRPSAEILAEIERLVAHGYRSITLLGQNVNSYGHDNPDDERSFAQLLTAIGEIGMASAHTFWVYFTSPHPKDITEDIFHIMARYPCLAQQLHFPLQSGDDKLLMRMNRQHTMKRYRSLVSSLRDIVPHATLFTDIIVGFTGESDAQFENTRVAMQEFAFNMAYIALYSPRPGATSARWDDDVPHATKKARMHALTAILKETSLAYNTQMLDTIHCVLAVRADKKDGYISGLTEGRLIVRFRGASSCIGSFVMVRITHATPLSLEGVRV